jgi:lactate dehydrogenase-like 2-hydroxyacid dehydrogenase
MHAPALSSNTSVGTLGRDVILAARNLRLIAQPAAGYNNIDVAAARERGVPVTLAPGYNSQVRLVASSTLFRHEPP